MATSLEDLKAMFDGNYEPPPPPPFDPKQDALFAGLSGISLAESPLELVPGITLSTTYAHLFAAPMLAFAPPPNPRAPHPGPWVAPVGGAINETVLVEIALEAGARPFELSRLETVRLVALTVRLLIGRPAALIMLANVPISTITDETVGARTWVMERPPDWPKHTEIMNRSLVSHAADLLPNAVKVWSDEVVGSAFSLLDGVWWLPTLAAQMIALWTAAETLMRPGRRDTAKELGRLLRAYIGRDASDGDRVCNEVIRLYGQRGNSAHAGHEPEPKDVQATYGLVRRALLRAILEGSRPPPLDQIARMW